MIGATSSHFHGNGSNGVRQSFQRQNQVGCIEMQARRRGQTNGSASINKGGGVRQLTGRYVSPESARDER